MTTSFRLPGHILPAIVAAQFACTSLWFAGNAVVGDMADTLGFALESTTHLTSAVQLGFISGTLTFALLTIADRYSPSKVFLFSALAGAIANLCVLLPGSSFASVLGSRFATGFFLAGIYPVGMKIAADYHREGLGKALGYLVGALVVGTALPHGLRALTEGVNWQIVIFGTSMLAVAGGLLILFAVPDGPFRKRAAQLDLMAFFKVFRNKKFRSAAFGYFGHMWELYSFWAFVPLILTTWSEAHSGSTLNIPALAFAIIGVGGLSCVAGGYLAKVHGSANIAFWALLCSGLCCVIAPVMFHLPKSMFMGFLFFWGMMVIADSPQFSTLVARTAPSDTTGTALTIVNCVGFAITIISIQVIGMLFNHTDSEYIYAILVVGPVFGLISMYPLVGVKNSGTRRSESASID